MFEELDKYGEIENLNVCDNLADHLVGNVYVKFKEEESAAAALAGLAGRPYAGAGPGRLVPGSPLFPAPLSSACRKGPRFGTMHPARPSHQPVQPRRGPALSPTALTPRPRPPRPGRPIIAEFSPVTDFREATCRQYEENTCARGGYCNFMVRAPARARASCGGLSRVASALRPVLSLRCVSEPAAPPRPNRST